MNLQALGTELKNDPLNRNYSGMDDERAAESLNAVDRNADRDTLSAGLLVSVIEKADLTGMAAPEKDYLHLLCVAQSVPITTNVKTQLSGIFPGNSPTRRNLQDLFKRPGSRAQELGLGHVSTSNVADARRLP